MNLKLKQLFIITVLSVCIILSYGCSITNYAINKDQKFHIYGCKSDKLICNLSDSTTVVIYPGPDQDNSALDLFESGNLTVKILNDIIDQQFHDWNKLYHNYWYEFDVIQPDTARTYSDTCKEFIEDEKTFFVLSSWSKIDADGSTLGGFSYIMGNSNAEFFFDLKRTKQNHFAIRYAGLVL